MTRTPLSGLAGLSMLLATSVAAGEMPAPYASPQTALDAMMSALESGQSDVVLQVFGTAAEDLVSTGNHERDNENRNQILSLYRDGFRFQPDGDGRVILLLGAEGWPFPIPIARSGGTWSFDIEAGRDEVYFRRVGLNELDTLDVMKAYVAIQSEFRKTDHDGDGVMEFANALISSPDARDGLYWGDIDSPMGVRIALANLDGYADDDGDKAPEPFGGYYYRILTAQSDAAPGGQMDYMAGPNMVAGHALLAVPSDYGSSGIHSFMVAENGIVLQADLGEDSLGIARAMTTFDPGPEWNPQQ